MSLIARILPFALLNCLLVGCKSPNNLTAPDKPIPVLHRQANKAIVDANKVGTAVSNAQTNLNWLHDSLIGNGVSSKPPTPPTTMPDSLSIEPLLLTKEQIIGLLASAQSELGKVNPLLDDLRLNVTNFTDTADDRDAAWAKKLAQATDAQKQKDETLAKWLITGSIILLVFVAVERATNNTYLIAGPVAGIAGGFAWFTSGRILNAIGTFVDTSSPVILWSGFSALVLLGGWYAYKRWKLGDGLKGLFRNTELINAAPAGTAPTSPTA